MGFDLIDFNSFADARYARTQSDDRSDDIDPGFSGASQFAQQEYFLGSFANLLVGNLYGAASQANQLPSYKDSKLSSGLFSARSDNAAPGTPSSSGSSGYVVIDAVAADGLADELLGVLTDLGLTYGASFANVVSGLLPLTAIDALENIDILVSARETTLLSNVGSVTTQADASSRADEARALFGVDGSGSAIGVLSDSFNNLGGFSTDVSTGDLPSIVRVLEDIPVSEEGTDEGRAILQIIHDIAPGASLLFDTAFLGVANFARGIIDLANAGANIIIDDVIYFSEPFFQDGPIAQAVNQVAAQGVLFFSSAGNSGTDSYESVFRDSGRIEGGLVEIGNNTINATGNAHDFDPGAGIDTRQLLSLDDEGTISLSFQYDEPFASSGGIGASSDYDIFLYLAGTDTIVASSISSNASDAVEIFEFTNETGSTQQYEIAITRFSGSTNNLLKYIDFSGDATFLEFTTNSPTLVGHANAEGAIAVGASAFFNTPEFGLNPARLNGFSSVGGVPILFDTNGNRLATPDNRGGPDFVAPDGGNTTFFGNDVSFDSDTFPNFFGTSASAPAAAAIAALLLERVPNATRAQVIQALSETALDIGAPGVDLASGAGLIQADAAITRLIQLTNGTPPIAGPTQGNDVLEGAAGSDNIDALGGNDSISGLGGNDTLLGNDGNDTLLGGDGLDFLDGGSGSDLLDGGSGDDTLQGRADNDTLLGEAGNDSLVGANGDDRLEGGPGLDSLVGGSGNDTLSGGTDNDLINAGTGNDSVNGDVGDDTLNGEPGNDFIAGGDGDDLINAAAGIDTVEGGAGADTISGGTGDDFVSGGSGNDSITTEGGLDSVFGDDGNDTISTGSSADVIEGGNGSDTINAGAGFDSVLGGADDDVIVGQAGDDTIRGGDGNDDLIGDSGNDLIFGDLGDDTIFSGSGSDNISGGAGNDELSGGALNDTIDGGDQNDTISGNAGMDILAGGQGDDVINGNSDSDFITGGSGNDTLIGISGNDTLVGGDGDDDLSGNAANDSLSGDAGNDLINAGVGDDSVDGGTGADTIEGGSGSDVLNGGADNDVITDSSGADTIDGGDGDDFINSGNLADMVFGGAGNDTIEGRVGDDTLDGGAGNDLISGGSGADTFVFADGFGNDIISDFEAGMGALDIIDLSALTAITDFTDLVDNHLSTDPMTGNAVISVGSDIITLQGVTLGTLIESDFIF